MSEEFKELNMVKQPNNRNQFKGEISMDMNKEMVNTLKDQVLQTERAKAIEEHIVGIPANKDSLVLGVGACGGNNAHLAHKLGYSSMAVNTSADDASLIETDHVFIIENAYGSGKNTKRAKTKFKEDAERFITYVKENCPEKKVFITGSGTGGTGAGLMCTIAMTIKRNFPDKDVFILAVAGAITEDINAQENMDRVFRELDKVGVNYLVFDNDRYKGSIDDMFSTVNNQVIDAIRILSGEFMQPNARTLMDPADWQSLLSDNRRMIVVSGNFDKRVSGDCDYEQQMIDAVKKSVQLPTGSSSVQAYGFFLNIKPDMYKEIDTDFRRVQETFGEPYTTAKQLQDKTTGPDFGLIIAGLDAPFDRLELVNERIREFNERKLQSKSIEDIQTARIGIQRNIETTYERKTTGKSGDVDMSAFDMFDEE